MFVNMQQNIPKALIVALRDFNCSHIIGEKSISVLRNFELMNSYFS